MLLYSLLMILKNLPVYPKWKYLHQSWTPANQTHQHSPHPSPHSKEKTNAYEAVCPPDWGGRHVPTPSSPHFLKEAACTNPFFSLRFNFPINIDTTLH